MADNVVVRKPASPMVMPNNIFNSHDIEVYTIVGGGASANQLASSPSAYVKFKAMSSNGGAIMIVTDPGDPSGFELQPGEYEGPLIASNTAMFYLIGSPGDALAIWRWR